MYRYLYLALLSLMAHGAYAATPPNPLNSLQNIGNRAYPGLTSRNGVPQSPEVIIGNIIKIALGFVGMIFLILMIVGGAQWMTSGGNDQKVGEAKKRITNAAIGLLIILVAYSITYFIVSALQYASENSSTPAYNTGQ